MRYKRWVKCSRDWRLSRVLVLLVSLVVRCIEAAEAKLSDPGMNHRSTRVPLPLTAAEREAAASGQQPIRECGRSRRQLEAAAQRERERGST